MVDIENYDLETISTHVGDPGDFISIDNDKCNNCGRCLVTFPGHSGYGSQSCLKMVSSS